MKFTATQVAAVVQGQIEGDENAVVYDLAKIEEGKEGSLCFLSNPKYEQHLYTTASSIVIINNDLELKGKVSATLIRVPNAYSAFAILLQTYEQLLKVTKTGVSDRAIIAETAKIGENVYIGAGAVIDEYARIGDNTQIYPNAYIGEHTKIGQDSLLYANVSVYHRCEVGNHCVIHSGAVVGCDGFGHAPQEDGTFIKIPQLGNVVLGNFVEIGANCAIDRATMGSTVVEDGAKLDNLIQIGHNAVIGTNTVIAGQAGISGSTTIGANNMIGGQAGIVGHISTANGVKVNAQSGVTKSIKEDNKAVTGSPAYDYTASLRSQSIMRKLPDLMKRIAELEQKLEELEKGA